MDNELYLIHTDDYLNHIDNQLEMYDLLLTLVREVRKVLENGEPSVAMRTLCRYEQQAHELYEQWGVPDEYTAYGDLNALAQLMENELLPLDDAQEELGATSPDLPSVQLLSAVSSISGELGKIMNVCSQLMDQEDWEPEEDEEPLENDCAV